MKTLRRILLLLLLTGLIISLIIIFTRKRPPVQAFEYLPHSENKEIISHVAYSLSFIDEYKEPEWVAYKLSRDMLNGPNKRADKFTTDPEVLTGSSSPEDFSGSGYDRGHLCPAADMNSSPVFMQECFYMSNMSPQNPSFNRGIWSKLEKTVRLWADEDSLIYITTGPVFSANMPYIGKTNKVAVPPEFYKVILCYNSGHKNKAIGFIIPNEGRTESLSYFIVSVDSVEARTGIDFFPDLPDEIEQEVESRAEPDDWDFRSSLIVSNKQNKQKRQSETVR
ncbi:MAG: DNA/RNA non-specific endonuclease [Ignavibacteria bacterium]